MKAQLLNGNTVAHERKKKVASIITTLKENHWHIPGLAVILIGNDPASEIYVARKRNTCQELGIYSESFNLPPSTSEAELCHLIHTLNENPLIDGILVQLPLPKHMNSQRVIETISPNKDVDGFHPQNLGNLAQNHPVIHPCTPLGIMNLLEWYQLTPLTGYHAVIIGTSNIVGKPLAFEFLHKGCTVTLCHRATKNLSQHVAQADILVSAIGNPHVIQTEWIKEGAIVIDVGINRLQNGTICGDIDFQSALLKASWLTPVPGGVGPMTIVTLMENTLFTASHLLQRYQTPLQLLSSKI